jgi:hypothetical protein
MATTRVLCILIVIMLVLTTMTMGRPNRESNNDDVDMSIDEPQFSLRDMLSMLVNRRTTHS